MPESRKIREYRETLQELAKPQSEGRRKELRGKSSKLGTEIHGEERKGKPKSERADKPRR
jgi:hypothetical protein